MSRFIRTTAVAAAVAALAITSACSQGATDGDKTNGTADSAAAKALIAPYVGQPSKFPIETPLQKKPVGKKIAYMDCGTPVCGLIFTLAEPAAQALGMDLTRIQTGQAADTVTAAFNSAVTGGFDGVLVPSISPPLWQRGLDALHDEGIPVVTTGVTGGDPDKIAVAQVSDVSVKKDGQLLAAYVVAEHGADVEAVFYVTPELPFTRILADAFADELKNLCPECGHREVTIPVATLGNRAPSLVVDDLQAHPDSQTLVFAVGEQANGLPAAMKVAGLEKDIVANIPGPETLAQVQSGDIEAALGLDLPLIAWTLVDSLARLTTGQDADPGAVADIGPRQFLTKDDLSGDVSRGWTGYPDFADRFGALWQAAS